MPAIPPFTNNFDDSFSSDDDFPLNYDPVEEEIKSPSYLVPQPMTSTINANKWKPLPDLPDKPNHERKESFDYRHQPPLPPRDAVRSISQIKNSDNDVMPWGNGERASVYEDDMYEEPNVLLQRHTLPQTPTHFNLQLHGNENFKYPNFRDKCNTSPSHLRSAPSEIKSPLNTTPLISMQDLKQKLKPVPSPSKPGKNEFNQNLKTCDSSKSPQNFPDKFNNKSNIQTHPNKPIAPPHKPTNFNAIHQVKTFPVSPIQNGNGNRPKPHPGNKIFDQDGQLNKPILQKTNHGRGQKRSPPPVKPKPSLPNKPSVDHAPVTAKSTAISDIRKKFENSDLNFG